MSRIYYSILCKTLTDLHCQDFNEIFNILEGGYQEEETKWLICAPRKSIKNDFLSNLIHNLIQF
jgi:polyphosphate kinase